jgi:hypothetical protein
MRLLIIFYVLMRTLLEIAIHSWKEAWEYENEP